MRDALRDGPSNAFRLPSGAANTVELRRSLIRLPLAAAILERGSAHDGCSTSAEWAVALCVLPHMLSASRGKELYATRIKLHSGSSASEHQKCHRHDVRSQ
jgi:hypothetical protein